MTSHKASRARKLVLFDMDGTLMEHKNVWLELHKVLGTWEEGKRLTDELLHNDYEALVDKVIHNLWKGKPAEPFLELVAKVDLLPGARETIEELRRRGFEIAVITSGPDLLLDKAKRLLGITHGEGNHLEIQDGVITGRSRDDEGKSFFHVTPENKVVIARRLCNELGCELSEAVAVGDGRNDVPLFKSVKRGIAFNDAPTELKAVATHTVPGKDVRAILEHVEKKRRNS